VFWWKNIIVVSLAFLAVGGALIFVERVKRERERLSTLLAGIIAMLVVLMTPVPYALTMLTLGLLVLVVSFRGVPIIVSYLALTAVTPMLTWYTGGFAGMHTLLMINSPLVAAVAVFLAFFMRRSLFIRSRLTVADGVLLLFILVYTYLSTRGGSMTGFLRPLVESSITLGGAYLAASRGRIHDGNFLLKAFALLGGSLALVSLVEALKFWPQFQFITIEKGVPLFWVSTSRMGLMRSLGPFADPITFSLFLSSCFLGAWGLFLLRYNRAITGGIAVLIVIGMFCTFSRTGSLALAAGLGTLILVRRNFAALGVFVLAGAAALYVNSLLPQEEREGSTGYRVRLVTAVLEVVQESPLTGDNRAIENGKLEAMRQGQGIVDLVNSYFGLLLTGGIILLAAFLLMPLAAWRSYLRARSRYRGRQERIYGQIAISQMMGLLVGLYATSLVDKNLVYVIVYFGMLTGLWLGTWASKEEAPAPRAQPLQLDELRLPSLRPSV
jgi:hypothetical protein